MLLRATQPDVSRAELPDNGGETSLSVHVIVIRWGIKFSGADKRGITSAIRVNDGTLRHYRQLGRGEKRERLSVAGRKTRGRPINPQPREIATVADISDILHAPSRLPTSRSPITTTC